MTHICVSKLAIIDSDNGLSPGQHQAIILTSAGILLIGPLGTNFSEILIAISTFSFKKMYLKIFSGKWRPSCLCLNVLNDIGQITLYVWCSFMHAETYGTHVLRIPLNKAFNGPLCVHLIYCGPGTPHGKWFWPTLAQVMACCLMPTSHSRKNIHLSSMRPLGI